jgi:glycerophosphoryl diester phosphodiesterase
MSSLAELFFHPPVIAHRGVRAKAPENTLAAFRLAKEAGVGWIETDVKLTHDGVPILMHDDTLDRTTNGHGPVADKTWDEIRQLDAGGGERVPSLAEALHFAIDANINLNLEIKPCPGRTQATTMVALIEVAKMWPDDRPPPLVSSFDIEALAIAAMLHPEWPRGLLLDDWRDDWLEIARLTGASTINMNADILTQPRVAMIAKSGLPLLVYTVNEPLRARELLRWGVSAVFSDDPQAIIGTL